MVRQHAIKFYALIGAGLCFAAAASPAFADSSGKQKSPPPRINVHVGKVTKSPDHPDKGGKKG